MEFKLGQRQDGSGLFPKGWEELYKGDGVESTNPATPGAGLGQPQTTTPTSVPEPAAASEPTPVTQPAAGNSSVDQTAEEILKRFS